MSIKDSVRPVLPPTSRAFLNVSEDLLDRVESLAADVNGLSELTGARLAALQSELARQTVSLRYVNLEYASKLPRSKADILIAGYYGAENFGDELMLSTILQTIPSEQMERIAVLLWDNPAYPTDTIDPRITKLHYPCSTWDLDYLSAHFSTLVWGGGAIIDDRQYTSDPQNTNTGNLFIRLSAQMLALGKRVFCLGLSANDSISSDRFSKALGKIVDGSALFSLRDPLSLDALERCGIATNKVELCQDIVFANRELEALPKAAPTNSARAQIGIVCLTTDSLFEYYVRTIDELGRALSASYSEYEITLVPFYNEMQHDVNYCTLLKDAAADSAHISVAPYAETLRELDFSSFSLLISYKYHSALIALVQGTPTILVYDAEHPHYKNKMNNLASLFNVDAECLDAIEFEKRCTELALSQLKAPQQPKETPGFLAEQQDWLSSCMRNVLAV